MAQSAPVPENVRDNAPENPTRPSPMVSPSIAAPASSPEAALPLRVVYPPNGRKTTSDRIFLIGSAPPTGEVRINGQVVRRSASGNFAPSFPLRLGSNGFTVTWGDRRLELTVERQAAGPGSAEVPQEDKFRSGSLQPTGPIARLVGEPVCFQAIAPANQEVTVGFGAADRPVADLRLAPQPAAAIVPSNADVLVGNLATPPTSGPAIGDPAIEASVTYAGCQSFDRPGELGSPIYRLSQGGQVKAEQAAPGSIAIWSRDRLPVVAVTAPVGVARTGPSTDHSRLTPLPQGTRALVTGREGDWWRLDYGGWLRQAETAVLPGALSPQTIVQGIRARVVAGLEPSSGQRSGDRPVPPGSGPIEVVIPLQVPVPFTIDQTIAPAPSSSVSSPASPSRASELNLTLYGATAATDTLFVERNTTLERLTWQQLEPGKLVYHLALTSQPWGYSARYDGSTLVLRLRSRPQRQADRGPLGGLTILLDPGHGGGESGAVGPTGLAEKTVTLRTAIALEQELTKLGARVILSRRDDRDVSLVDRVALIAQTEPTIALSIHYNALPDNGNAETTQGVGMFWYHPQAEPLARSLHDALVTRLDRPSYGVFWGNLALTRPTIAPAVLLELGFMSHPEEFDWVANPQAQADMARTIAQALVEWFDQVTRSSCCY